METTSFPECRKCNDGVLLPLSDYGRDRLAYQGYDLLFDPVLRPSLLPIGNRHVMKVQAALAVMDWLAMRIRYANT